MNEIENWEIYLREHILNKHTFTVECSLKNYSKSGNDLLIDLLEFSEEAFAYCSNKSVCENLLQAGWIISGKRYKVSKGETKLQPNDFYNINNTFVFIIDIQKFKIDQFFKLSSKPYVVGNIGVGLNKNAWLFSRNVALKKDKVVFCTSATSPSFFNIVLGKTFTNIYIDKYI